MCVSCTCALITTPSHTARQMTTTTVMWWAVWQIAHCHARLPRERGQSILKVDDCACRTGGGRSRTPMAANGARRDSSGSNSGLGVWSALRVRRCSARVLIENRSYYFDWSDSDVLSPKAHHAPFCGGTMACITFSLFVPVRCVGSICPNKANVDDQFLARRACARACAHGARHTPARLASTTGTAAGRRAHASCRLRPAAPRGETRPGRWPTPPSRP